MTRTQEATLPPVAARIDSETATSSILRPWANLLRYVVHVPT